ncbi:MAG TPA: hypothetical protein VFD58_10860 [Blastocatellia bacterium]|nr:hypothetical protein [Blastocatellia bacterium]
MNARAMIENLRRSGFALMVEGDGIRVTPASALTGELRSAIREHKPAIIEALASEDQGRKPAREVLAECLARHECPECHQPMTFQQREPETYFCPHCRLWSVEGRLQ